MVFLTTKLWGWKTWIKFWILRTEDTITIKGIHYKIKNDNFVDLVANLAVVFEVLMYDDYGKCEIKKDDTVIDIGGHIGSFALYAASKAKKVYAFEPFEESYNMLQTNIKINNAINVIAFNTAVGSENRETTLYLDKNRGENSLYKKTGEPVSIKMVDLKTIFENNNLKYCNVLKMDCEGGEYAILFSSEQELKKIDRIIMEYHLPEHFGLQEKYSFKRLVQYLKNNDFSVEIDEKKFYQGILYAKKH
ncbi:MAG: FkbM family methyltransferase [archaeon]